MVLRLETSIETLLYTTSIDPVELRRVGSYCFFYHWISHNKTDDYVIYFTDLVRFGVFSYSRLFWLFSIKRMWFAYFNEVA